jgi:hypothetical protein
MSRPLLLLLALAMTACTFGPLRQSRVEPLAPWRQVHGLRVLTSGAGSPDLHATLSKSAGEALATTTDLALAGTDVTAFELHLQVTAAPAETPAAQSDVQDSAAATARTALGLGLGEGSQRGQLAVTATLHAPGRPQPVGLARWTAIGSPDALALDAGHDLGDRLGRGVTRQRLQWLQRRAADERLFLTPTPLTVPAGHVAITSDQVLLWRLALGLTDRLQLDLWLGGLPIPIAAGGVLPLPGGILAGGAGGGALFGVFDLGLKYRVLEETDRRPGVSLSYDMLDLFGASALAGGGVGLGGSGAGGGGFVGVGGANVQFNVLIATVGKHFGNTHLVAGGGLLDNHHFLGQSARFTAACGGAGTDGSGTKAILTACTGSKPIDRLPTTATGFVSIEQVLGPHSSLGSEVFPRWPLENSMVTTGARWLLGGDRPRGPIALDRIRFRLDAALAWFWLPANPQAQRPHGAPGYVPWLGIGVYVQ